MGDPEGLYIRIRLVKFFNFNLVFKKANSGREQWKTGGCICILTAEMSSKADWSSAIQMDKERR